MEHEANNQERERRNQEWIRRCRGLGPDEARSELETLGVEVDHRGVAGRLERMASLRSLPERLRAMTLKEDELDRELAALGVDATKLEPAARRLRRRILRETLPASAYVHALSETDLDEALSEQDLDLRDVESQARRVRRRALGKSLPASLFALQLSEQDLDQELAELGMDVAEVEASAHEVRRRVIAAAQADPATIASMDAERATEALRELGLQLDVERAVRRITEGGRVQLAAREAAEFASLLTEPAHESSEWSQLGARLLEVAGRHRQIATETQSESFVPVRDAAQNLGVELRSPKRSVRRALKALRALMACLEGIPAARNRRLDRPVSKEPVPSETEPCQLPESAYEWLEDLRLAANRVRALLESRQSSAPWSEPMAGLRLSIAFHNLEASPNEEECEADEEALEEDASKLLRFEESRRAENPGTADNAGEE